MNKCIHNEHPRNCGICEDIHALENLVESLKIENSVLRNEVRAARLLGDASPLALEYCKQQWLDAVRATDEFDKERNK